MAKRTNNGQFFLTCLLYKDDTVSWINAEALEVNFRISNIKQPIDNFHWKLKTNAIIVPKVGYVTSLTVVTNLLQCKDRQSSNIIHSTGVH